jgi:hypothetical protein
MLVSIDSRSFSVLIECFIGLYEQTLRRVKSLAVKATLLANLRVSG